MMSGYELGLFLVFIVMTARQWRRLTKTCRGEYISGYLGTCGFHGADRFSTYRVTLIFLNQAHEQLKAWICMVMECNNECRDFEASQVIQIEREGAGVVGAVSPHA
ncbi:hypothetical protein MRB53_041617 [Persea americana]|nr:hypothetical protein MRB53_041617 [Persea americana]